jgi:hypothetical protein
MCNFCNLQYPNICQRLSDGGGAAGRNKADGGPGGCHRRWASEPPSSPADSRVQTCASSWVLRAAVANPQLPGPRAGPAGEVQAGTLVLAPGHGRALAYCG